MTLEEKAKEYAHNNYEVLVDTSNAYVTSEAYLEQGYLAGAKENGTQWHDLLKDPNDLPKEGIDVLVKLEDGHHEVSGISSDKCWFCTDYYTGEDKVIKWKEIE